MKHDAIVLVNDQPGWQCNASRFLNMGQANYTAPAPLCDRSTALSATQGIVSSQKGAEYPGQLTAYQPNAQCSWVLPALPQGSKVVPSAE